MRAAALCGKLEAQGGELLIEQLDLGKRVVGDVALFVELGAERGDAPFRLVILDLPERRGPAVEAQACYSLATD